MRKLRTGITSWSVLEIQQLACVYQEPPGLGNFNAILRFLKTVILGCYQTYIIFKSGDFEIDRKTCSILYLVLRCSCSSLSNIMECIKLCKYWVQYLLSHISKTKWLFLLCHRVEDDYKTQPLFGCRFHLILCSLSLVPFVLNNIKIQQLLRAG